MDKFVDLVDKPGQLEELRNLNQKLDKEFEKIGDLMETITSDKPTLLLEAPKPESETRDKFTEAYLYKRLLSQIDKEKMLKGDILVKTKINNLKKITDEQLLEKINDEYPLLKEVYRTYRDNKSDTTKTGIRMVREIADQSSGRVSHTNIDKIAKAGARYRNKKLDSEPEVLRADIDNDAIKIFGFGAKMQGRKKDIYETLPFGRYELNKNKLDRNIISVHHMNSLNPVKFFKNTNISDDMKDLIYFISEKHKFNKSIYNSLSEEEKELFKMLFEKSGLSNMMEIKLETSKYNDVKKLYKDLKERYELLDGEIMAGNDNPKINKELKSVVKELKKVLTFMIKYSLISKRDGTNMILSL
jgi:hypothetical protein